MSTTSHRILLITALLFIGCRDKRDAEAGRMDTAAATSTRGFETKLTDRVVVTFPARPNVENDSSEAGVGRLSATVWNEKRYYSANATRRDVYSNLAPTSVMKVVDAAVNAKVAAYARIEGGTELSRRPVTVGAMSCAATSSRTAESGS